MEHNECIFFCGRYSAVLTSLGGVEPRSLFAQHWFNLVGCFDGKSSTH